MEGSVMTESHVNGDLNLINNKDMDAPEEDSSPVNTKAPSIDDSGIVCDEGRFSGSPDDSHTELNDMDCSTLEHNGHSSDHDEDIDEELMDTVVTVTKQFTEVTQEEFQGDEGDSVVVEEEIVVVKHQRQQSGYTLEASEELNAGSTPVEDEQEEAYSHSPAPEIIVSEPTEPACQEQDHEERPEVVEDEVVEEALVKQEVERKHKSVSIEDILVEEPEPEPEVPRVEFRRGTNKVDNVEDALDILKTRYRLSGIPARKVILTWSSWNLKDLIHQPYDSAGKKADKPAQKTGNDQKVVVVVEPGVEETIEPKVEHQIEAEPKHSLVWADKKGDDILDSEEVVDLLGTILDKEKELEELLESVLEEERKKKAEEAAKKKAEEPAVVEEEVMKADSAPQAHASPTTRTEPDEVTECQDEKDGGEKKPDDEAAKKKKRGNVLARMVRALRKRLGRRERA